MEKPYSGIIYSTPTRRRFVPNSWLMHAEVNEDGTRLEILYTHCVMAVTGTNLGLVLPFLLGWEIDALKEGGKITSDKQIAEITQVDISERNEEA
jgi:hypothetical protein